MSDQSQSSPAETTTERGLRIQVETMARLGQFRERKFTEARAERDRLREVNAELLAALKSIIRLDDEGYPENNIDAGRRYRAAERDAWRAARAAIAKAEAAS